MILKPDNLGVYQAPRELPGAFCAVTQAVFEDEPCLYLAERNMLGEDSKTKYRYQILKVVRDDKPANAYICLGLSSVFTADELDVPGSVPEGNGRYILCHTVAELRDIAEDLRNDKPHEVEAPPMQQMWWDYQEEKGKFQHHESTFGAGGWLVRP